MKKLFVTVLLFCFVLSALMAQYSMDELCKDITVDGTEYSKTGFVAVNAVTIAGSGSKGAFIDGRTVMLTPYIIGKYPVTQEFYKSVAEQIPDAYSNPSKYREDTLAAGENQGLRPVERVDFFEVARFCNKLSELQGLELVFEVSDDSVTFDITKNGWRIPTEAEWECAARGGSPDDTDNWNNLYAGASEATVLKYAWVKANGRGVTHEVGLKEPNSLGIYDLLGNVFEWCLDLSGDITAETVTNPTGATSGTVRVQRGCGISSSRVRDVLRRDEGEQTDYWNDVGFRLCRTISEQ